MQLSVNYRIALSLVAACLPLGAWAQTSYWETQCRASSRTAPLACSAAHSVLVQDTGQLLFRVTFETRDGQPGYGVVILSPLGIYLPNGLALVADDEPIVEMDVQRCGSDGCLAGAELTQAQAQTMYQASSLQVRFSPSPQETVLVDLPAAGLADALQLIAPLR